MRWRGWCGSEGDGKRLADGQSFCHRRISRLLSSRAPFSCIRDRGLATTDSTWVRHLAQFHKTGVFGAVPIRHAQHVARIDT